MIDVALGAGWGGVVLVAAWRRRPRAHRARALGAGGPGPSAVEQCRRVDASPVAALGRALLRVCHRPASPGAAVRLGRAVAATAATGVILPLAAPAVGAMVWGLPAVAARRQRRRRRAELLGHLPEVADLFVLAVGAGLTVPLAVASVARRVPGPLAAELRRVVHEVDLGRRIGDALEEVPARAGEEVRPLVAALLASERYGAPLLDGLARLATELRADRRRRAEEAARRVPVKLLFPLVFCTLPAFALLTVAPLLAGAVGSLRP
ncbi:MAG TPA: type II secretion system F family protein [Acidimicrobiales bacterium]|nr:type II secretion system F family protein [Acidimicrobiales bacterium]